MRANDPNHPSYNCDLRVGDQRARFWAANALVRFEFFGSAPDMLAACPPPPPTATLVLLLPPSCNLASVLLLLPPSCGPAPVCIFVRQPHFSLCLPLAVSLSFPLTLSPSSLSLLLPAATNLPFVCHRTRVYGGNGKKQQLLYRVQLNLHPRRSLPPLHLPYPINLQALSSHVAAPSRLSFSFSLSLSLSQSTSAML